MSYIYMCVYIYIYIYIYDISSLRVNTHCLARSYGRETLYLRHARPSVRMYQRGSHWTDFREIWYWELYANLSRNCRFG